MTKLNLERGAGLALWRQIANQLRADVMDGHYGVSGKIPREIDLAALYSVNRHTVRRAIAALTSEGLLEAQRGEGTFVSAPKLNYPVGAKTRFHEIVAGQARVPHGGLISSRVEKAGETIAAKLDCHADESVWRLETLYCADETPISTASMWFLYEPFKNLPEDFQKTGSLTQALKLSGVLTYVRQRTFVSARCANEEEAARLKLPSQAIVLVTEYISHDAEGCPLQFSRTRFASDRVQLIAGM